MVELAWSSRDSIEKSQSTDAVAIARDIATLCVCVCVCANWCCYHYVFHSCRFKFSESAFLDNKIYVTHMVKNTVLICGMTIVYL